MNLTVDDDSHCVRRWSAAEDDRDDVRAGARDARDGRSIYASCVNEHLDVHVE